MRHVAVRLAGKSKTRKITVAAHHERRYVLEPEGGRLRMAAVCNSALDAPLRPMWNARAYAAPRVEAASG